MEKEEFRGVIKHFYSKKRDETTVEAVGSACWKCVAKGEYRFIGRVGNGHCFMGCSRNHCYRLFANHTITGEYYETLLSHLHENGKKPTKIANSLRYEMENNGEGESKVTLRSLLKEIKIMRTKNAHAIPELKSKVYSEINKIRENQNAAVGKLRRDMECRDIMWREDHRKVTEHIAKIENQIKEPRELVMVYLTEEMERRVIKKVQPSSSSTKFQQLQNKVKQLTVLHEREESSRRKERKIMKGLRVDLELNLKEQMENFWSKNGRGACSR